MIDDVKTKLAVKKLWINLIGIFEKLEKSISSWDNIFEIIAKILQAWKLFQMLQNELRIVKHYFEWLFKILQYF